MNWHEPTDDENNGVGDWSFMIDIQPDIVPHQAGVDGDALIRIARPGWSWVVKDLRPRDKKDKSSRLDIGHVDTREAAIGEVLAKLATLREGNSP
jgi:hypothetical protein